MNEKISEKLIREEKIKKLKEKIYSEIENISKRNRKEMRQLLLVDNTGEYFEENWNFLIAREFCLERLREYISSDFAFQTIEAEYPAHDLVIYQVSDEYLNIWLQDDYNFTLSFLGEIKDRKTFDVYEILNDRYFGYEFVSAFEVVKYRKEHE